MIEDIKLKVVLEKWVISICEPPKNADVHSNDGKEGERNGTRGHVPELIKPTSEIYQHKFRRDDQVSG